MHTPHIYIRIFNIGSFIIFFYDKSCQFVCLCSSQRILPCEITTICDDCHIFYGQLVKFVLSINNNNVNILTLRHNTAGLISQKLLSKSRYRKPMFKINNHLVAFCLFYVFTRKFHSAEKYSGYNTQYGKNKSKTHEKPFQHS